MRDPSRRWWERPGLEVRDGRLLVTGRDAEELARRGGTSVFVYDLVRLEEQARSLLEAFERAGVPFRLRLALKAQRDPQVLVFVRQLGFVGIDACSPGEVLLALEHGWAPEEISYTGTNVSERDLDVLLRHAVHLNVDLVSQLARMGARSPGASIGIRVNPRAAASRSGDQSISAGESIYAAAKPTKFGILEEQLDEAVQVARKHRLVIDTVHAHVGDGFLTDALPQLEVAIERLAGSLMLLREAPPLAGVTIAGNINEGDDLWAEDLPLPEVHEGDIVAMLAVGTYNQSMHLDHCLRPPASVIAFADRLGAPVP